MFIVVVILEFEIRFVFSTEITAFGEEIFTSLFPQFKEFKNSECRVPPQI